MTSLSLHVVREDATTFTLGWEPVQDAVGYVFFDGEGRRSHTWDKQRRTVRVFKAGHPTLCRRS